MKDVQCVRKRRCCSDFRQSLDLINELSIVSCLPLRGFLLLLFGYISLSYMLFLIFPHLSPTQPPFLSLYPSNSFLMWPQFTSPVCSLLSRSGKSNPYCEVTMGDQVFTSRTLNDTVNPKWNFNCQFHIRDVYQDVLCITIYERDLFAPDGQ